MTNEGLQSNNFFGDFYEILRNIFLTEEFHMTAGINVGRFPTEWIK